MVKIVSDEIEECFELGVASSLCYLFSPIVDLCEEGQDFFWTQRTQFPVAEVAAELRQD